MEHVARKLGRAKPLPTEPLPDDRSAAVAALDAWAGSDVDWHGELRRYYEEHIPVQVRPAAAVNATLRRCTPPASSSSGPRPVPPRRRLSCSTTSASPA